MGNGKPEFYLEMEVMGKLKHNHLILIGLLNLVLGAMIYFFHRPPTLLCTAIGIIPLYTHTFLGQLEDVMPSFLHTFSFTLLTVGLGKLEVIGIRVTILFWFFTNIFFEIIQWDPIAIMIINETQFSSLSNFVQSGTFDFFDIIAITLGSLTSFLLFTLCCQMTTPKPYHQ